MRESIFSFRSSGEGTICGGELGEGSSHTAVVTDEITIKVGEHG